MSFAVNAKPRETSMSCTTTSPLLRSGRAQAPTRVRQLAGARNNFFAAYGMAIGRGWDGVERSSDG